MRLIEKNLRVDSNNDTATMSETVNGMTTEIEFTWRMANYVPIDNAVDVFMTFIDAHRFNNDTHKKAKLSTTELLEVETFIQEYIEDNAIDYGLESLMAEQLEMYEF